MKTIKTIKRFGLLALTLVFSLGVLTGCGSSDDEKTIKVAASPSPHAEILEKVKGDLEKEGWKLEIVEIDDYVKPNQATTDGDVDANYFQHQPYLTQYNEENGTDLVSAAAIHYEAMGIYKGTASKVTELKSGDKIGVPNDVTNEARALQLLEANGIITLKDGAGETATKLDIASNPYEVEIVEVEAAQLPKMLPDFAFAVINGNYALDGGLTSDDAIALEDADSTAAQTYANIVCCRKGEENSDKVKALVKALQSQTVKDYIGNEYGGVVKTIF